MTVKEVAVGTVGVVKLPILTLTVLPFAIAVEGTIVIVDPETVHEDIVIPEIAVHYCIVKAKLGVF